MSGRQRDPLQPPPPEEDGPPREPRRKNSRDRWLWPAAALAVVAGLFLVLTRLRDVEPRRASLGEDAVGAMSEEAAAGAAPMRDLGGPVRHQLIDRVVLTIPGRGVEAQLLAFLEDPNRLPDQTTWFELDRTVFEPGSATLASASADQLDALAAILRAWPTLTVKIGGYTDDSGDRAANRRLSRARAEAVRAALIEQGIPERRIEAEGYGEQFPVADNATAEGRARNRRVALRVIEK